MGVEAERTVDRLFFRRLDHLPRVARFVSVWVALVVVLMGGVLVQSQGLSDYYEFLKPVPGGVHTEGVLGNFTTANPLYATSNADTSVSRLVFSSLLTYDNRGNLAGDLAKSWQASESETVYTITLKDNLRWHDGAPLTAEDVVFTYKTIQNPDAQSPLFGGWQGIAVAAKDTKTVVFTLNNPLSSFTYSLTNGIVPKHLLDKVKPANLRTAPFNTVNPVGSGPFTWRSVEVRGDTPKVREERIALISNKAYYGGTPKLDGMVIRAFHSQEQMTNEFKERRVDALAGLDEAPAGSEDDTSVFSYSFPLRAEVMSFFKMSEGVLANKPVRQALVRATDQNTIIQSLGYPSIPVVQPLLRGQLAFDATQQQDPYDLNAAMQILQADGWVPGKNGIREKAGQPLKFTLTAKNTPEFTRVSSLLQQQWKKAGADVKVILQNDTDFETTLGGHLYEALLYGISIGNDPDVYAYWHSSQADIRANNRLNFSEYKSDVVDDSISAGRIRLDAQLRTAKYKPFLEAWKADAPAVGLYQPRYLYVTRGEVFGLREHAISTHLGRYSDVQNWMTQQARVTED